MTCWRRINDDQIGGALEFEFLDFSENEQMLEAGCCRSDHRERGGGRRSSQEAANSFQLEIVAKRLIGRNGAASDRAARLAADVALQYLVTVVDLTSAQERTHSRATINRDKENIGTGLRRRECVRGCDCR